MSRSVLGMAKVLLVAGDPSFRSALRGCLSEAAYSVRDRGTALGALRAVLDEPFDLVLLDRDLPDLDGLEMLGMLRAFSEVPVVVMTARHDDREKARVRGHRAADLLVKPFSLEQLIARMTTVLRRAAAGTGGLSSDVVRVGGLVVDAPRRRASLDGTPIDLKRKEFDLLEFLARRPGVVVARDELFRRVWLQTYRGEHTVDVHLCWLRRKLGESAARPRYLHTVHRVGIKLEAPEASEASL